MRKFLLILLCLGSFLPAGLAQDRGTSPIATLYRGRTPDLYPFKYNGTYYLYTKDFSRGDVMYNGVLYRNILLNLDAYAMELQVRPDGSSAPIVLYRDRLAWFTMGGSRFVNLRYYGVQKAQDGFYELAADGTAPLFSLRKKLFKLKTSQTMPMSTIEQFDGNYDPDVVNYFDADIDYYVLENGALRKLGRKAFRRAVLQADPSGESPLDFSAASWHPAEGDTFTGTVPENKFNAPTGLPENWFSEKSDKVDVQSAGTAQTVSFRNKEYHIGTPSAEEKGLAKVSGTVIEAETDGPLAGVVVWDEKTETSTYTSSLGRFSLDLPRGENVLHFIAEAKDDLIVKVFVDGSGSLDVIMTDKATLLREAVISAESMAQHQRTAIGIESVSMKTIGKIPSAFGEGDIVKAMLTLPGVQSVGEASGGFNVRGGAADQNLVLLGENTIYNPSHLFGIFSAFNPDVVDGVELYKSSIPAEYGGRLSSVLSVRNKTGDMSKVKGSLGIGVLTSRFHLEGPLSKGKTSFIVGARTTYSDWILKQLPTESAYSGGGAGFTDVSLGLTHRFDGANSLSANGYFASDRFAFSGDTTFRYRNLNGALTFQHKEDDGLNYKISGGFDRYGSIVGAHNWEEGAYDLETVIRQGFLKAHFSRALGSHTLSFGADAVAYFLDPGNLTPFGELSKVSGRSLAREKGLEPAAFVSDNWQLTEALSLEGGLRFSSFLATEPSKFYGGPELRLSTKYTPVPTLSLKAGFNTMRQYIHLISNTAAVSPMDTWKLSSATIAPTTGWQGAGGIYWTLAGAGLDLSLEAYYKQSSNLLDYKTGAELMMNPNLDEALVPVDGKAYGIEFMLRKPAGRFTGRISYSYSSSMLRETQDRGAETINHGDWYNAPYDKPHEIKAVGNFAITHRISVSANVDYSTGRPVTIPVGRYEYGGKMYLAYSDRNTYRIPDYFRVDLAMNFDPGHYLKALAHASVTVGVYNVLGRKNAYSVFFRSNPRGEVKGYMMSVFATQIPYININLLF